ncbi:MAG: PAB-dependent poly(A)-specific ribonuclease subunit 2, partial [Trebouxia sp. A1-2]
VLAITCGLTDGADLAWWQPWRTASTHRPWLPWAITVQVHVDEWRVEVQEGERFQDMLKQQHDTPPDGKVARAVYELTAVVAHVMDAAENSPAGVAPEGHLVAHVKVLTQDVDSQYGIAHSPIGPSPSQSPLAFRPFGSAPTGPPSAYSSALARTASASNNSNICGTALARTASATGSGNISRLSESTNREEGTGGLPRGSRENTGANTGEVLMAAQSSQQSLTSPPEEDKHHQSPMSLASDVDSLPSSDPAVSQPSTDGKSAVPELDKTVTASALSEAAQQKAASGDQADTGNLQVQAGQLSTDSVLAAGPEAASEGLQAANKAPAAALNDAELQQSMDAMLSGEDQAMQECLAAANAAGGERVGDFLSSKSSGLQLLATAEPSSGHRSPPEEEAAALGFDASPAGDGPTNDEAVAEATESNLQPGSEPADGPALEKSYGSGQIADRYRKLSLVAPPASASGLSSASSRHLSDGQPPSPSTSSPAYRRPDWLLFNDFSITPCAPAEVLTLFGNQKVPCLLYYSRVDRPLTPAEASVPPAPPSPVLTTESFQALCSGPPVQSPSVKRHARNFEPLSPEELQATGLLLGIDAEFVAHAPAEKVMQGGVEVEVCKARLGLARVSVVRGEGPAAGSPAIDDYIRSLEPISDYLTKWSGLVPGDLDPKVSPHYLTTMKKAYLKLRYLVDSGCIFVGHDLRHDFKSINIIVPPQQVIDTVFLFHFKRQRKLSLRFLAGYLLGEDIQQNTHDSIEDARTAVKLYQKYKQLVSEGRFQETLLEMYRWGKQHAWDPLALRAPTSPA